MNSEIIIFSIVEEVSGRLCAEHPKGRFLVKGGRHLFSARSLVKAIG